jgi:amino acid adenylation domain-containing protein
MLVQSFLEATAARLPEKTALVFDGRRFVYRSVDAMANRVANALRESGVRRGDRVAVYLPNSAEAVVALFGTLKADAVFVPVNRTVKAEKLSFILRDCQAAAVVTDARALGEGEWWRSLPDLRFAVTTGGGQPSDDEPLRVLTWDEIQARCPASRPPTRNIDLDLACLIYTSGTTGEPKGVMCDHASVEFASASIIEYLGSSERDVVLGVMPLSFDYGLYQVLMTFCVGGTLVLENSFAFPALILQRIAEERVTGFPGVPTIFAMLLQMDLGTFDLSSLRYVTNTAAALPPSHILALKEKLPGVTVYSMYGLTETKRTLYLPPDLLDTKPGSVGVAIPGTEVWLEDERGNRLGPGEVGELVVRGRHVMRGYWEAPEATAARFRPGPLPGERVCHTGDLFRMDDDGFMYFVARKDDIIKTRGEKVAPKEVENVLHALPGVAEAAVVGVPDPLLGQAIKAVVVRAEPGLTAGAVMSHCKARLEDFMVPRCVEFVDALPRSASGKVRKQELA